DELLAGLRLDAGAVIRAHQDDAVGVVQIRVALDQNLEIAAVIEADPGAAVRQGVGVHGCGRVERRAHAGAGFAVPGAAGLERLDVGLAPQNHFLLVRAAVIATGYEHGFTFGDFGQRPGSLVHAANSGRVLFRTDDD